MEAKYTAGDYVKIKDWFWKIEPKYDNPGWNNEMKQFENKEYFIECLYENSYNLYKLKNCPWVWHEEWLELVDDNAPEVDENELLKVFG